MSSLVNLWTYPSCFQTAYRAVPRERFMVSNQQENSMKLFQSTFNSKLIKKCSEAKLFQPNFSVKLLYPLSQDIQKAKFAAKKGEEQCVLDVCAINAIN